MGNAAPKLQDKRNSRVRQRRSGYRRIPPRVLSFLRYSVCSVPPFLAQPLHHPPPGDIRWDRGKIGRTAREQHRRTRGAGVRDPWSAKWPFTGARRSRRLLPGERSPCPVPRPRNDHPRRNITPIAVRSNSQRLARCPKLAKSAESDDNSCSALFPLWTALSQRRQLKRAARSRPRNTQHATRDAQ